MAAAVLLVLVAAIGWLNLRGDEDESASAAPPGGAEQVARGAYLARAGNCQDCHTPRGAEPYSGGRGIPTPFGTVFSSNLTPDRATGIGDWTAAQFRRALHQGRSRDGRLLYPAFPYDSYTYISAGDANALLAYLQSLPAVDRVNRPHELRFPYNSQVALALWRALYFRPARFEPEAARSAEWNRGAYLVRGLGHCSACHAERNALGATRDAIALAGGLIPLQNWYAPALGAAPDAMPGASPASATQPQMAQSLQAGVSGGAAMLGPMAEVVLHSTQHLTLADLQAMARYLQSLPSAAPRPAAQVTLSGKDFRRGEQLYAEHCASCHGANGQGAHRAYAPLAGNPAVLRNPPANLVHVVLGGAFAPSTAFNPRPFGMPPFATLLGDEDIAAVLSYIRNAWGNRAAPVQALDISRYRSSLRP